MTGRASRSVPRINEESLSKVTAIRTNAQPRPSPTATRNSASAAYARSEYENETSTGVSLLGGRGRHQAGADDDVAFVENGRLPARDAVRGLGQHELEALRPRLDAALERRRAVAQLRRRRVDGSEQSPAHAHAPARERLPRPDGDGIRPRVGGDGVQRLRRRDAEPAALTGGEPPVARVRADTLPVDVHERAFLRPQAVPLEERAVVVAGQEARLLALGTPRGGEAGRGRLGARLLLRLRPQRKPHAGEKARVETREHVALVLLLVCRPGEERHAVAADDARVVTGREACRSGPAREGEQLGEAEAAVAADARVRRLAARVAAHERLDDGAPERPAQVERDVRQPERVARLARREHRARRAARALRVRPARVEPEPQRHADRLRPGLEQRDRAVDAAAHADGHALGVGRRAERRAERVRERVDREHLAPDRRGLEQRQPAQVVREPVRVGVDDSLAVDAEPDVRPILAARRVTEQLAHRSSVALAPTVPFERRAPTPPSCRARVKLASQVGAVRAACARRLRPDPGSLSRGVGSTWMRGPTNGVGHRRTVDDYFAAGAAYDQCTRCTPCRPRRRASASVTSNARPGSYGPRSTTCVRTCRPWYSRITRAPQGSVGCAMPSVAGRSTPPHAVRRPKAAGPADPTSATRSPTGRGAADDPPLPPQPLAAAAIAAASSAAAAVAKRPCSARPGTRYDLTRAPGRPAPTGAEGAVRTGGPAPRSRRRRRGAGSGAAPARRAGRGGSARARAAARGPKLFRRSAPKQFPPAWALARGPKLFRRSAPKQFPPAPAPARARGPKLFRPERSKQFPSAAAPARKLLRPARSKQLPPVPARARPTARAAATPGCPPEGGRAASRRGAPRAARRARSTSPPRRAAPPGTAPRAVRAGAPAAGRRAARTTGADRPPRSAGRCGTRPTRSRRRAASRAPSRRRSRRRRGRLTRAPRRARADTSARRGTAGPGAWSSSAGLRERGDAELREHRVGHRRRGARERIGAARDLREGDHLADVGLPRHERDETVDPHREAAVRRRAHRERLEQEAELPARFLVRQPHRAEDALLHRHVVDADRARAELPTVPDQVVVLTAHAGRVRLVPLLAARRRRRERMVHERPASVLVLLEQREVGHPVEGLRGRLGELQLPAEVGAQTAEDARDRRLVAGGEQRGRAGRPGERFELALRQ